MAPRPTPGRGFVLLLRLRLERLSHQFQRRPLYLAVRQSRKCVEEDDAPGPLVSCKAVTGKRIKPYAVCDPANTASANVMKRLGMQFRGLETWYGKNLATYQITSDEWHARAGEAKSDSR